MTGKALSFELDKLRKRLAGRSGPALWSSVEELLDEPGFRRWAEAEFPDASIAGPGRREFLRLVGASLMLAGVAGCRDDRSDLALPYVTQPEQETTGLPTFYATALCFEGWAQPVVAKAISGRPIKLDGNPDHPTFQGGSDPFMQMAVLELYDPGRSQTPVRRGAPAPWAAYQRALAEWRSRWMERQGEGLRILTGNVTSPTLLRQLRRLRTAFPQARLHLFEPVGDANRPEATKLAFGRLVEPIHALDKARVIVSIDDDLLGPGPRQVPNARAWMQRRGEVAPGQGRSRLHVAESVPTLTGCVADARLAVDAGRVAVLVAALALRLDLSRGEQPPLSRRESEWVDAAAHDLAAHRGQCLLTCGAHLPPPAQALAAWINEQLGNAGHTVTYLEPISLGTDETGTLADLVRDMAAGAVETLIVLDCNPVYTAPGSLRFDERLEAVSNRIHAGLYYDETAAACGWHLPLAHALESWGDVRASDGTATIIQPVLAPLYDGRTSAEIVAMLAGPQVPTAKALVQETWQEVFGSAFDERWRESLRAGFVAGSAHAPLDLNARPPDLSTLQPPPPGPDTVDIAFRPDPCVWDGRFGNIAWLQELPKPLTKITWDCPVAVSPRIADRLGLANGDLVEVSVDDQKIVGPAWIMPGQAPSTIALHLGYGRAAGEIAAGLGYSAFRVRPPDAPWLAKGRLRRVEGHRPFATSQLHHRMEGFDFVRTVSADRPALPAPKTQPSLYPDWNGSAHAWGMVIDLDRCIGCNACSAACNIENNVLVVGRDQVEKGREMLWLRVDRYYAGDIENPQSFFQPVPCMHCEKAPCEMGCPVNATVHSTEGVNQQVYNRCIGTRTCSSYCPYKVRRFNWYDYRRFEEASQAAYNPDVTVRSRGVMEKCTYCVQRVQAAHVAADKENRAIAAGEVVTACQQACPTRAITFGNIANSDEDVAKLRKSGRHYVLLEELGTRPRTTYLARWDDAAEDRKRS